MNFRHLALFPTARIKTSWIVDRNIWVYCVEFPCAKKQSFLLLEVWWWRSSFSFLFFFYSDLRRFIPPASFNSLWLVHSEITTKKNTPPHLPWAWSTQCHTWCKLNLENSVNLLFICKWRELSSGFFLGNAFRHPRLEPIPASPGNMSFQQLPGWTMMTLDYFPLLKLQPKSY